MKKAVVFIASGFEEIEALTVVDVLRRAEVHCDLCSIEEEYVTGSHNITIKTDVNIKDIQLRDYDAIILPGGMPGANNLKNNLVVIEGVKDFSASGRLVAAICAAPIVLEEAGIIHGRAVTSYPSFRDALGNCIYKEDKVVEDLNILTSRGPSTALNFAFEILKKLGEEERANQLKEAMLFVE